MNELGREMAIDALHKAREQCMEDRVFTLGGREWHQLAGVVGSEYNTATELFTDWLPYAGVASMLEMGAGCGVAAISAALSGCPRVLAVDINPHAVESVRLNASRHGVADRVTALRSDLFAEVEPEQRFDLVFWNSPFINAPISRTSEDDYLTDHFFDPGYRLHDRFFLGLGQHLAEDGRAFLGFSAAMGDVGEVESIAARRGFTLRLFRDASFAAPYEQIGAGTVFQRASDDQGNITIDFTLMELVR
ncbi:methyltransferase [Nocardiopsis algeriensis]|uniref:Release factor glutamine methyltransferase n=1 Tax=Nocardiopsis algeriensis TaxID=1478215 RepID=A0A841IQT6_9ACTN|nr:methyltransferase [Nocardiopsis algeriensis]MBB6120574.1 release factor glutamine methyltransferase [Nocardiopsis algeriensis]